MCRDNVANVQAFSGRQWREHNVIMERGARQDPPRTVRGEGTRGEREREAGNETRWTRKRRESGPSSARITEVEKKGCWNEGGWNERRGKKNRVLLIIPRLEMLVLEIRGNE